MGKRANVVLIFVPIVLTGLLLFLSQTMAVRGSGLESRAFSRSGAPLLQADNETEPNDAPDTADPIEVNRTMSGAIPILQTDDVDWYILTLPAADLGRNFVATLEETTPDPYYRLELRLYDADESLVDSDSSGTTTSLEWASSVITYYLRVRAESFDTVNAPGDAAYVLTIERLATDPTPTPTSTPVPWDECEPNNSSAEACLLSVGIERTDLNFMPYNGESSLDRDFFNFRAKAGNTYRITTDVSGGADTFMRLFAPDGLFLQGDDDGGVGYGSQIERTLTQDGFYTVLIEDVTESDPPVSSHAYDILVEDITPATSTPTPTPTPADGTATATPTVPSIPGKPDNFEPNWWFDRATLIGIDAKYTNLNFVPWSGNEVDTDFFKLWVVAGKLYTCETSELGTATNTNIIFCSGPSWEQCFAGNDDVQPFDADDPYRSRLQFFASYDGYLYVVLGQVGAEQILPEEWENLSYSLQCYIGQPGTATPTPTSEYVPPPPTPYPTSAPPPATALPSPTPARPVVRPMSTPSPPPIPTPIPTATPGLYVVEILLYYDRNENGQADAGEGISDALARAYDAINGDLLSIDYTDETGYLRFTVPDRGPVRVSIPFFGFSQVVTSPNTNIQIRISPQP